MADNNNNNNNERRRKLAVFAGLLIQQTERKVLSHLFTHSQNVNQAITLACLRKDEKPRIEGYVESVIPRYDPDDFREHFRLSRESFEAVLTLLMECNEIPQPGQDGLRGKMPILIEKQLLIFLWYLGNNETFRSIADRFGVSMSTAHECWRRISKTMVSKMASRFITWPHTQQAIQDTTEGFRQLSHLPSILGAIDGTHIRIKAPRVRPDTYINRKKFPSIVLQGVCNSKMLFTNVYAGWPGSCHDARVWRNSPFYRSRNTTIPDGCHLVGDSAYPLEPCLMTPFRDYGNLNQQQKMFNRELSRARQVIERSFGQLKGRFRKLRDFYADDMELIVDGIVSACILHNICILNAEELVELYDEDQEIDVNDDLMVPFNNHAAGVQRRLYLLNLMM